MENTNSQRKDLVRLTQMSILVAILIIMAFTPLGYLKTAGVEITFMTIPVVVGAIVLGPTAGAILGGIFGITSFIQCFGLSAFGAALLSINPFFTLIICLVPRILMGYFAGIIFKYLKKIDKTKLWSFGVASLSGALLNTIFFMITLMLLFGNSELIKGFRKDGKNVLMFMVAFVGINGLIEAIVTFVIGTAISKALVTHIKK